MTVLLLYEGAIVWGEEVVGDSMGLQPLEEGAALYGTPVYKRKSLAGRHESVESLSRGGDTTGKG